MSLMARWRAFARKVALAVGLIFFGLAFVASLRVEAFSTRDVAFALGTLVLMLLGAAVLRPREAVWAAAGTVAASVGVHLLL